VIPGLVAAIDERTARGITTAINREIRAGRLLAGQRLPTVRELAVALEVSPTTVSESWRQLTRYGSIEPRGRNGTFIRDGSRPIGPRRYRGVVTRSAFAQVDLSTGIPDPDLLPDIRPALARVSRRNLTTSYLDSPMLPALHDLLTDRWPFVPEMLTMVDGAMDALDRAAAAVIGVGDHVLVEEPGFPPLFDLIEQFGGTPVGVRSDAEGMLPDAMALALKTHPVALICQPRAQNPTGYSMSRSRTAVLASLLAPTSTVILEDDHSGDIAWAPPISFGEYLPSRTVLVRSYSKSHGPDLRLAAVGGAGTIVTQIVERRMLGPGWSSRLLQAVLLEMLRDKEITNTIAQARSTYHDRRTNMVKLLDDRNVQSCGDDGINLWVAVNEEEHAQLMLSVNNIAVAPGSPFWLSKAQTANVRLTVSGIAESSEEIADALAIAAK
jgi:DNA-binding transcriptional MocR family regulator